MKTGATRDPHWHSRLANVLQFSQHDHRPHSTIGNNPARRFADDHVVLCSITLTMNSDGIARMDRRRLVSRREFADPASESIIERMQTDALAILENSKGTDFAVERISSRFKTARWRKAGQ